jgi:hypothetical protein
MMPWSINLRASGKLTADSTVRVTADITYPCPQPFDCSAYPASNTNAEIHLPPGMNVSGSPTIDIGNLAVGRSATISWNVKVISDAAGSVITVSAGGEVSGAVPQVSWNGNQVSYPAYNYTDEIGGEASVKLPQAN